LTRRRDADGFRWADKFAKLARNAFRIVVLILDQIRRAAITSGQRPFLFGIFHRHDLAEKQRVVGVLEGDFQSADNGWQIKLFPKLRTLRFTQRAYQFLIHSQTAVIKMFTNASGRNRRSQVHHWS